MWPHVDRVFLILPHYGILLALFPLVRRLPTRWLLPAAGAAFLLPSAVIATVGDLGLRAGGQPSSYAEVLDLPAVLGGILWTGGYPIVGWAGFVLVGPWLVGLPLRRAGTQWGLFAGSLAVAATQPLVDGPAFLDSAAHRNQTAWYVLASSTAVAVVATCLLLGDRARVIVPSARWR